MNLNQNAKLVSIRLLTAVSRQPQMQDTFIDYKASRAMSIFLSICAFRWL